MAKEKVEDEMKRLLGIITIITLLAALSENVFAGSKSAILQVTTRVLPVAKYSILYQTDNLIITETDIKKGYIDVQKAMVLSIKTNSANGYILLFSVGSSVANELTVFDGNNAYKFSEAGGEVPMPYQGKNSVIKKLSFRFRLSPDSRPGTYQWPVAVMVTAL